MAIPLEEALAIASKYANNLDVICRIVLSGRRRNFQPKFERITIRPVLLKEELKFQVIESDGLQDFTTNFSKAEFEINKYLEDGYANVLIEMLDGTFSLRITKKGEALVSEDSLKHERNLEHDRKKTRLLDSADPFLIEVGISDTSGKVKPSRSDKYLQVEEFLRILLPTIEDSIKSGKLNRPTQENPIHIVDLGCGNAYLTFAAHQYLNQNEMPVKVSGVDIRPQSLEANTKIASKLGISSSIKFKAETIAKNSVTSPDVVIALHACDTASDDAIAWGINNGAKVILVAPCCHHDLQTQLTNAPEPWSIVTKSGLMKERLGDLLTDSIRAQILKLKGFRTDIIEFIASEHTPRNLLIRAVYTGAKRDESELAKYKELCAMWGIAPALSQKVELN